MAIPSNTTRYYRVESEILDRFPQARIGVGIARITVEKKPGNPKHEAFLSKVKQEVVQTFIEQNITMENYLQTAPCRSWSEVFKTYEVSEEKQCTLNPLFRKTAMQADAIREARALGKNRKADIPRISNIVDLCNCVAATTGTPMGVLNLQAIDGDVVLRYGREGEKFTAIHEKDEQEIKPSHVVLSDHQGILAWLWTHKVSQRACVPIPAVPTTFDVLVCSDQAQNDAGDAEAALHEFFKQLPNIGGEGHVLGIADRMHPEVKIEL